MPNVHLIEIQLASQLATDELAPLLELAAFGAERALLAHPDVTTAVATVQPAGDAGDAEAD